jgi:hypothetical protein
MLVATDREVLVDGERGTSALARVIDDPPACVAADVVGRGRTWCGTRRGGMFRSDDTGRSEAQLVSAPQEIEAPDGGMMPAESVRL